LEPIQEGRFSVQQARECGREIYCTDGRPIADDDTAMTFLAARMAPVIEDSIPLRRRLGVL
jgi:hypothetical protein